MKFQRIEVIECGATTCVSERMMACKCLRLVGLADRPFCLRYDCNLLEDEGSIMRCENCTIEFTPAEHS